MQNYPKRIIQVAVVFYTYSEANANPKFWKLTNNPGKILILCYLFLQS